MRSYPRRVFKGNESRLVNNEIEEMNAAEEGFESSDKPDVIKKRKGTDRDILRRKLEELQESEAEQLKESTRIEIDVVETDVKNKKSKNK